jgi:hypothetical protein
MKQIKYISLIIRKCLISDRKISENTDQINKQILGILDILGNKSKKSREFRYERHRNNQPGTR